MRNFKSFRLRRPQIVLYLAVFMFGGLLLGMITFLAVFVYFAKDLPEPGKVVRREGFATRIVDRNGKPLYEVYDQKRRVSVEYSQIPDVLKNATIAVEDKDFYKHSGFDPLTPFRMVYNFVFRRGRIVGGSTLTQQLVKNVLLTNDRTVERKLKELILTLQVESKYSKNEILQMYLNEAPYGGVLWGVGAASDAYFGKPVWELNLPEAAILAGLPQWPSKYSPYAGDAYIDRAKEVLRRMREDKYIDEEQRASAEAQLSQVKFLDPGGSISAPHFVFFVRDLLEKRYGERALERLGLTVTTTLDLDLQEQAQKIVQEELDKVKHLKITNAGLIVTDPKNGQILSMVGSKDWSSEEIDGKYNVVTALRQPGSTIKPMTYLAGFRKGFTAATMLMDTPTAFPGGDKPEYIPENYDKKFRGPVLVREALGNSLNIPAVKMLAKVGIVDMLKLSSDMGISTLNPTPELLKRVGLSVTLGGGEVRLSELANAYNAFANGGKKTELNPVLKVVDREGRVLEEWREVDLPQIILPEEAYIMSSILSDPNARSITFGTRSSINIPGRTVAVKTGTTNDRRDNWTIGWTPSRLVGVWVGNNDNSAMREVASGITGAAPIWNRVIKESFKGLPVEDFATPSGIVQLDIDRISGHLAHSGFDSRKEYFVKGTQPEGEDLVHKKIKVCKGEGKLATPADVSSGNYDEREALYFVEEDPFVGTSSNWNTNRWQEGILKWLSEQQDPKYKPPVDYCGSTNPVWIRVIEPQDKSRINGSDVKIRLEVDDVNPIKKVEISLDSQLKHTFTSEPYEITLPNITNGKHRLDFRAENDKGQVGTRYVEFSINEDFSN